ncbi:ubiquitinyl hydrolase [Teratosphaeria nubilosa]|uniref:Ubiquitin carboxyl-terminal hydrolase n=1 Tax=Teratosphaeria nubilosa TaxID=161662 RepID=A0A6G1LD45_9PEZI|nr:ubiquitinyl hydrolase [Teratosphaeria nubilosa]
MASCPHVTSTDIHPPRPSESVYREDCTLCFDSIDDPAGLDVCLTCFNGGCSADRIHGRLHAQQAQHPLAVNIKRTRKRKERAEGEPPEKISKLAIKAETDEDRYDIQTDVHCFECGVTGIEKKEKVGEVVDGVLKANTFAKQEEVKAWEQEMIPCEHTLCLEQEAGRPIPSNDLSQCSACNLKENLWLCLTCGNLGCGRSQFGGLPGNSHARAHGDSTSHPVAVKLGSLTADGNADIYCYQCDEERVDPELTAHLATWGIDIAGRVKTEKSLTEMQIDENLRWEFSMLTDNGKEMKPMFGPGFTGLKNLGNSCYLNSVLQSIFSFPEFANRYYRPDEPVPAVGKPAEDLEIQLRKVADGLLSGRYSKPNMDVSASEETHEIPYQKGLALAMLKHLIGRGHAEFSTMRQQDSFELLLHLLKLIVRSQQTSRSQYKDIADPVEAFRFVLEQKLQCLQCKKVRYRQDEMENLSVAVPIKRLPQSDDTKMTNGANGDKDDKEHKKDEVQFEPVTLKQCLDDFTAPEVVELTCAGCGNKGFTKQSLFKTFPSIFAINARRFEIVNWVPTKQDVPVIVGDEDDFDMEAYRSKGKQAGEEELPEDQDASAGANTNSFTPNEMALEMLMSMGFPRPRCERALHATGNQDAEAAASWLFEHMEDPDIDQPLDLGGSKPAAGAGASVADPEKIESLGAMGFSAPQARQALKETGGDMERAVDWLFNHPDATGDFGDDAAVPDAEASAAVSKAEVEDTKPAKFGLKSIVCHKGSSIHAGHYVAFIKKTLPGAGSKKGEWILFNDEKVALGADAEEMKKFAYIYFFRRQGV